MIAVTIITHPRPPTDKGSQPRGTSPRWLQGSLCFIDKAANSGTSDNYGHSLSWRTSNKQWAPSLIPAPALITAQCRGGAPGGGAQELHSPFPKKSHSWEFSIAGRLQRPRVSFDWDVSKAITVCRHSPIQILVAIFVLTSPPQNNLKNTNFRPATLTNYGSKLQLLWPMWFFISIQHCPPFKG